MGKDPSTGNRIDAIESYFLYFMAYSVIGWLYETVLEVFVYRWGFSNRGVLFGPYLPVYGFGALIFLVTVYHLIKDKPLKRKLWMIPVVFLGCVLVATSLELVTTYIMQAITGSWPWQNYLNDKFNFQGRIALSPSVRFGIGGVFFLYLFQPLFERAVKAMSPKVKTTVTVVLAVIIGTDLVHLIIK